MTEKNSTTPPIKSLVEQLQKSGDFPQKENFEFAYKTKSLIGMKIPAALKESLTAYMIANDIMQIGTTTVRSMTGKEVCGVLSILENKKNRKYHMDQEDKNTMNELLFALDISKEITQENYLTVLSESKIFTIIKDKESKMHIRNLAMKILARDWPGIWRKKFAKNIYEAIVSSDLYEEAFCHISDEIDKIREVVGRHCMHKEISQEDFADLLACCSEKLDDTQRKDIYVVCEKVRDDFALRIKDIPSKNALWSTYHKYIIILNVVIKKISPYCTPEVEEKKIPERQKKTAKVTKKAH